MIMVVRRYSKVLCNKLFKFCGLLTLSFSFINHIFAANQTVNFSALIAYEGSCEIKVPEPIKFNNGEAILPSVIESSAPEKTVDLTLSKCQGIGVKPKIGLSGTSTAEYGPELFRDPVASTAVGYGILLRTNGNSTFQANSNLAKNKAILAVPDWSSDTSLTTINGKLPLIATLTCGDCNFDRRMGGSLEANITFEFLYE